MPFALATVLAAAMALPAAAQPRQVHPGGTHVGGPAPRQPAPHPIAPRPIAAHPDRAAPRVVHGGPVRGPLRLDQRYHHDHYYPGPGFGVTVLPAGTLGLAWRDGNWFFHGGVWFRPMGSRYVVAVPPPGIVTPYLPPAFVSLWIGGVPYYYANGVYYSAVPEGYAVVAPPPGAEAAQPLPMPPTFILYPRNGQSGAQMEADRIACNDWAASQPGAGADASVFQRGFEACMDARGYTVR